MFLLFFGAIIIFTTNYFSNMQGLAKESEFRGMASNFFEQIFGKKGVPENWYSQSGNPVQAGLIGDLYQIPIIVEGNNYNKTDELISINLTFDKNCENNVKNSSVRVFSEDYDEINFRMTNQVFCSDSFLKTANLIWLDNISANQKKNYFVYYSQDNINNPNYTVNSSLIGYWNFNENYGNIAHDSSINNNDGVINEANWNSGKYEYGLEFDGINDYVNVGNPAALQFNNTNSFSIAIWFKINSITSGGYDSIFYKQASANRFSYGYHFEQGIPNLTFSVGKAYVGDNVAYSNSLFQTGAWYYVVGVYSSSESKVKLYINGSLSSQTDYTYGDLAYANDLLYIGGDVDQSDRYFNGTIDEVRIYNRVLSEDEINASYYSPPITVKIFPEEKISGLSIDRILAIRNKSVDDIRKTLSGDYKFKIEVFEP
jgi:hypothetical protein